MNKRKLYIGAATIGELEVIEEISNDEVFLKSLNKPKIDTYSITFDYLIQCGVDKVVTEDFENFISSEENPQIFNFLKNKTSKISSNKIDESREAIERIFKYYLPEGYNSNEKYDSIWYIQNLLESLVIAANTNTSVFKNMRSVTSNLEKAKDVLPLELYKPIHFLINSIKQDTVDLPFIGQSLEKRNLDRFNEIFESKTFEEYKLSHSILDTQNEKKNSAISNIQRNSVDLYRKNKDFLNIRKGIITTLSITPKIIDASLGKIPGSIADLAVKFLTSLIEIQKRVIIYDQEPLYDDLFRNRILIPLKKQLQEEELRKNK
ncbi:hypothetical protein [Christiangramia sp. OXR-203]|uniref:hypothetical protein n=1 Tax=Christiangramia sp. OXR-203 TaxID=3100176 RepID=UPI002AC92A5F|nr:hypothetical protein [Christiangramia sp. OXR-203]WPY97637.1 hypothetical protein T8I65_10670 [Christiangramia sp. OXR-203]